MHTGLIASEFPLLRRFGREFETFFDRFSPPLEVVEKNGRFIVRADVPGLKREDIKVEVTDHELTIEGERRAVKEEKEEGFYRSERSYGAFFRSISLPEGVNVDRATAIVKDGVLEVTMPMVKAEAAKRRLAIEEAAAKPVEAAAVKPPETAAKPPEAAATPPAAAAAAPKPVGA